MAAFATGDLTIPVQLMEPWLKKVSEGSVVARLATASPMKFGKGEGFTYDIGEAELVSEGAQKGPSEVVINKQTLGNAKFHKTVRMNEEVLWADEDHRLGVVQRILDGIQPALSRALDFGALHGTNPATGQRAPELGAIVPGAVKIPAGEGVAPIDAADRALLAVGHIPTDMAMAPGFAGAFATLRDKDGRRLYPDMNLGAQVSIFEGHRVAASRTVAELGMAGVNEDRTAFKMTPSGVAAIVGDFSSLRWGVQKSIGLEVIKYGDPDGLGDLKRHNQVAFRAEVVYGWGFADPAAFAVISAPAA